MRFIRDREKAGEGYMEVGLLLLLLKCCLVSSDVSWHIRDKLWPMPKHGSINLYVHGNQKARYDGQPSTSTSTLTQLLNYDFLILFFTSKLFYELYLCNWVYCIQVSGYNTITFSFRSFSFLIEWEFYGPSYLRLSLIHISEPTRRA